MHFTLDDYRKIEAWLQTRTIKDTILPQTTEVRDDDLYSIVLGGINKTIKYKDFMKLGAPNGVAPLDNNGIILSKYLPSYVDDVLEFDTFADFPEEGEEGKIYLACDTNFQYRWSGSLYVTVGKVLELGERNDTAFPGDRGKALEEKAVVTGITIGDDNPYTCTPSIDNGLVDLQLNLAKNSTLMLSKHYLDTSNHNYIKLGVGDSNTYISPDLVISNGFGNIVGEDLFGYFSLCEPNNTGEMTILGYSSVLGLYSVIAENVNIQKGVTIGSNVNILSNVLIGESIKIGNNVEIEDGLKFNINTNFLEVEVPNSGIFSIKPGITVDKSSSDLVIPQNGLQISRDVDNDVLICVKQGTKDGGWVTETFPLVDHEYAGLMSYEDKIKLDKIDNDVFIGDGTAIGREVSIDNGILLLGNIGQGSDIGISVTIDENVTIGSNVTLSGSINIDKNASIGEGAIIGKNVNIGEGVTIPSDTNITPTSIDNFDDLWVTAGGNFNADTDKETYPYEANGVKLTYEEARVTYQYLILAPNIPTIYYNSKIKTTLAPPGPGYGISSNLSYRFSYCSNLEVIEINRNKNYPFIVDSSSSNCFINCSKLERIDGWVSLQNMTRMQTFFINLPKLKEFELAGLKCDINLSTVPMASYTSIAFLVERASNTSAITITVHADVYAKLTGDYTNVAASELTDEEKSKWTALYTTAQGKNITFATA